MRVPETIRGLSPLKWKQTQPDLLEQFKTVLNKAKNNRPLQEFFEENPVILLVGIERPHRSWVLPRSLLPKPKGDGWIPDFLICNWTSLGPRWTMVVLESPVVSVTNTKALSGMFNHAHQQIKDYRHQLLKHADYVQTGDLPGLDPHCNGCIVIGRRYAHGETNHERLAWLRKQRIEAMSYDRLIMNVADRLEIEDEKLVASKRATSQF